MIKSGEEIVCANGHVCGKLLTDVVVGQKIVVPQLRSDGNAPFSIELDKAEPTGLAKDGAEPTGYVCRTCNYPIVRCHNSTYQVHTRQGWLGDDTES